MNRDSHRSQLEKTEYSFALNANTGQEQGEFLNMTNEPSNNLSTVFPEGYKVIGVRKHLQSNRTYYILTNPETEKSSIGYVNNDFIEQFNEDTQSNCGDCENQNNLSTPLEEVDQQEVSPYVELINDLCHEIGEGLNLDIEHPVKFLEIKTEKGQVNLYWNDYKNPPRWMNVTDTSYLYIQEVPCDDNVTQDCIIVDKLLQYPKRNKIIIQADKIEIGGNLKLGSYEFYAAYCDLYGNNITDYSTPTNPIDIFDENNNILSQTELDNYTNFAIRVKLENLDTRYPYYKVVCVERNNVNNTQSGFLAGIFPTVDDTVVYSSSGSTSEDTFIASGNKRIRKRVDLAELTQVRTIYDRAKGSAAIQGKQYMWGLYKKPELNMQPVANLFGSLLKWQSTVANEDLYKSGVATSKYKGYMRNEVQPFALRFFYKTGGYSANLPLVARPNFEGERDEISTENPNRASLEKNSTDCVSSNRTEKWQIFNTARQIDFCDTSDEIETETIQEVVKRSCTLEGVATIPSGDTRIVIQDDYVDLETYINDNYEEIIDPNSELYQPELAPFLEDDYEDDHCNPIFGTPYTSGSLKEGENYVIYEVQAGDDFSNVGFTTEGEIFTATEEVPTSWENETVVEKTLCGTPSLSEFSKEISSVENEQILLIEKCVDDYRKTVPPEYCSMHKRESSTGEYLEDTDFRDSYAQSCGDVIYTRDFKAYNEDCLYAENVLNNNIQTQTAASYFHNYYGSDNINDLLQTKDVIYSGGDFENKLHKGALFFKIDKKQRDSIIFEMTKQSLCDVQDDIGVATELRYNFYASCNTTEPLPINITASNNEDCTYTPPTEGLINVEEGLLVKLDVTDYPEEFYVAIDAPIDVRQSPQINTPICTNYQTRYVVTPTCGCFSIFTRDVQYSFGDVSWDEITIDKKETYSSVCQFEVPIIGNCDPVPYAYGEFSYWESTAEYPDNEELYNSSSLIITEDDVSDLSEYDRTNFEEFFTNGLFDGRYLLKSDTDFRCKPIRHYKFPDNAVAPFMSQEPVAPFSDALVYPLGIMLDSKVVVAMLKVALRNNLITQEDYDNIEGYEILRGDNTVSKSVIANGLGYDMYKYTKGDNLHLYSNYPHNDLGTDILHYEDDTRQNFIEHPYDSEKNNRFTFLSPDIFLTNPPIPSEAVLSGYQIGNTSGRFVDVEDHSKWTILGAEARSLASFLGGAEALLEAAIKSVELFSSQFFIFGLSTGSSLGIPGSILATGLYAVSGFIKAGQYRYEWLRIFRDLGSPHNFASYNVSHGYHNRFLPNTKIYDEDNSDGENEYIRGLSINKYLKDGRYVYRDTTVTENKLFINNWKREKSAFLSTGDYFFHYDETYRTHDNNNISPEQGSRTIMRDNECSTNIDYERNVGSPYFTLKNYIPDQYGTINNVKWLTTNYFFNIDEPTECKPILGGTVSVSRFTWKRKLALFTHDAMNLADKLPFSYGDYDNIGNVRFYVDYESESRENVLGVPFPDIDSNYNLDCPEGTRDFYVTPPSKFYLYQYGVADFLVESEINCNFRYGRKELKDNFYPSVGDIVDWTQEKNVPISEPNTFFYNNTYSLPVSNTPYRSLTNDYSAKNQRIISDQENAVIWSEQDLDENTLVDPWLIYKPLNWFEFPSDYGKLYQLKEIEGGQVLARFGDRQMVLNAVDNLADRMLPQTQSLGQGNNIFTSRPKESNVTDLGFAGTQHSEMVSTPYGHFSVDAKRGKVFMNQGQKLEPISDYIQGRPSGMKNWFRENLPFEITKVYPDYDVDNKFNGIGLSMGWDAREDRVFLTKNDYTPKNNSLCLSEEGIFSRTDNIQDKIEEQEGLDWTYEGQEGCQLKFTKERSSKNSTDIYAFWDTSSMNVADGIASYNALQEWFTQYQSNNPEFIGNLYTIPVAGSREDWMRHPALIAEGNITYIDTAGWAPITNLPPNMNTEDWVPPRDLLLLSFVDETYFRYHDNFLSEGFSGGAIIQPTLDFYEDYLYTTERLDTFNTFTAVMYPIVQSVTGQGGALVLQAMAAIEGKILTQAEIDAKNTTIDVSLLLTENPYENFVIPNSGGVVMQPLKDLGWIGVYDKLSPAQNVFSSSQFQDDLNGFIENIETKLYTEEKYVDLDQVLLQDEEYFEPHGWTIAYKPAEGSWVSYYSFKPNYYVGHNEFFQTGWNWGQDEETLWSHNLNNTSLQVFQGRKEPFIIEASLQNKMVNRILNVLKIHSETKRYQNKWDFSEHEDKGFNKLVIYNNTNNSGMLHLNLKKSLRDETKYPIKNSDGTQEITYEAEDGLHIVNYFYNRTKNERNNVPQWIWDRYMIDKQINNRAVSFGGKSMLERMRGENFTVRLIHDADSRFKVTLKEIRTEETIYE